MNEQENELYVDKSIFQRIREFETEEGTTIRAESTGNGIYEIYEKKRRRDKNI